MFSLSQAVQSLSYPRRFLLLAPLPLILAGVLAWPRSEQSADFPPLPVPEESAMHPTSKKLRNKKIPLPRRDPFRPLNHPPSSKTAAERNKIPQPSTSSPAVQTASPAQPYRLVGILTVKGQRRALITGPEGTALYAAGDALPGLGSITELRSSALCCNSRELSVGEVWK